MSRGSGLQATGCGWTTEELVSDRVTNLHFSISSRPAQESTQPPIEWAPTVLSPGVKRQEREAVNSPETSAEVKKTWLYTYPTPYVFMVWCLTG
jgi:hypothetical protein